MSSSKHVSDDVLRLQTVLGIEDGHDDAAAKRWRTAVREARDKVVETSQEGVRAAQSVAGDARNRARSGAGRLNDGVKAFKQAIAADESDRSSS